MTINAADHLGLVGNVLKQMLRLGKVKGEYDDLFQIGCVGLMVAVKRFDPSRGVAFSTLACRVIWSRLKNAERKRRQVSGKFNRAIPFSVVNADENIDVKGTDGRLDNAASDRRLDAEEAIRKTRPSEREVFAMRVDEGLDWREIGRRLGISKDAAQQRYLRLVNRVIKGAAA